MRLRVDNTDNLRSAANICKLMLSSSPNLQTLLNGCFKTLFTFLVHFLVKARRRNFKEACVNDAMRTPHTASKDGGRLPIPGTISMLKHTCTLTFSWILYPFKHISLDLSAKCYSILFRCYCSWITVFFFFFFFNFFNYFNYFFPGLDGLPLPTTPSTRFQVLDY